MAITKPSWDAVPSYLGNHISAICPNGYADAEDNHCAHFVSHALGISLGKTCANLTGKRDGGASIRVKEVFEACSAVGVWSKRPASLDPCLIFITHAGNVDLKRKLMVNHPKKHMGAFIRGVITHYSNTREAVIQQTEAEFKHHYPEPFDSLFYGDIGKFVK